MASIVKFNDVFEAKSNKVRDTAYFVWTVTFNTSCVKCFMPYCINNTK